MKEHLLLAVIFGFLAGVFARSFLPLGFAAAGFATLLSAAAFLFAYSDEAKRRTLVIFAAALLAFAGGVLRMNGAVLVGDPELTARLGEKVAVEGIVSDEPDMRESNVRIFLNADNLASSTSTIPIRAGLLVVAPRGTSVKYGDRVQAVGTLRLPQAFDTGEGRQFNYPEYLAKDGIGYELAFAEVEPLGGKNEGISTALNTGNFLKSFAIRIKQKFLEGLGASLAEPQAGLAGGVTVGAKRGLGDELNDAFKKVGLTHVVVLSGYNIMIVVSGLAWALSRLHAPRAFHFSGAAAVAIFFALMTGGAASSVRAAIMAIIAAFGRMTGRLYFASRALGIVAFGMVLWNPFILAFDPGFQLSVLATLGLVWLTPSVIAKLKWVPTRGLREIAATTVAAQTAVLPLLLYQNGQLPVFSLPANLLALIAVPPAMFFSAIASLGGIIAAPIAPIVAFPAYALLSYIIDVAKFFSSLPFSSLAVGSFSAWWMFLAYAAMFGGLVYIKKGGGEESTATP